MSREHSTQIVCARATDNHINSFQYPKFESLGIEK